MRSFVVNRYNSVLKVGFSELICRQVMLCNIKVVTLTPNFVKKSNKIEKYKNDFMKKLILSGSVLALVLTSFTANSQQLPNIGFENWKTACDKTTWTSTMLSGGADFVRPGVEPADWNGSSVTSFGVDFDLVTKDATAGCAVLTNKELVGQRVPAYMTVGTPWVFVGGKNMFNAFSYAAAGDGGSYGGVLFTNQPDAISLNYQKTNANEVSHVIAYLWSGTFKANVASSVSGKNPNFTYTYGRELDDLDRAVLGRQTENVTQKGKLIASVDYELTSATADWTALTADLKYDQANGNLIPEKMNVILSAADYWTRSNIQANTELKVDDVKFVYYSRLASLTVGGVSVEGFASDKYEYEIPAALPATTDGIAYTVLGESPAKKVEVVRDQAASAIKVIVTNTNAGADAVDADGQKSHTYTLKYVYTVTDYPGYLTVGFGEGYLAANKAANVQIVDKKNGKCDFVLPNFEMLGMALGDIVVPDATTSADGMGTTTYTGEVKGMKLAEGFIVADVALNGTIDKQGKADMTVDVVWIKDASAPESNVNIPVKFVTEKWQMKESGYYFVVNSDDYQHPLAEKVATQLTILPESAADDGSGNLNCKLTLDGVKFTDGTAVDFGNLTVSGIQQLGDRNVVAKTYEGTATNVVLGNGETAETVVVSGSRTENNQYELKFAVTVGGKTRDIVFTTEAVSSGVEAVEGAEAVVYGTTDGIVVEGFAGEVVVYAADGRLVKVADGNMTVAVESGLYLVRTGAKVTKVIVK